MPRRMAKRSGATMTTRRTSETRSSDDDADNVAAVVVVDCDTPVDVIAASPSSSRAMHRGAPHRRGTGEGGMRGQSAFSSTR